MNADWPKRHHDWWEKAACRGKPHHLFLPLKGDNSSARRAREVCDVCPVADACREWAMDTANVPACDPAIYGGLTKGQRAARRVQQVAS